RGATSRPAADRRGYTGRVSDRPCSDVQRRAGVGSPRTRTGTASGERARVPPPGSPCRSARVGRDRNSVDVAFGHVPPTYVLAELVSLRGLPPPVRGALVVHAGAVPGAFRPVREIGRASCREL